MECGHIGKQLDLELETNKAYYPLGNVLFHIQIPFRKGEIMSRKFHFMVTDLALHLNNDFLKLAQSAFSSLTLSLLFLCTLLTLCILVCLATNNGFMHIANKAHSTHCHSSHIVTRYTPSHRARDEHSLPGGGTRLPWLPPATMATAGTGKHHTHSQVPYEWMGEPFSQ